MGQIEMVKHLLRIIIVFHFKTYSGEQIICMKLEYLINEIAIVK